MDDVMNLARTDARKGAALLDAFGPPGWRELVDLSLLDIEDLSECVLGQVYGGYFEGRDQLFAAARLTGPWPWRGLFSLAAEHGFTARVDDLPDNDDGEAFEARYDALTRAWREIIRTGQLTAAGS